MPVTLMSDREIVSTEALVDTGADINILPYQIGIQLGFDWTQQRRLTAVSGNLGQYEAKGIMLAMRVDSFDAVRMAFAWIQNDMSPIVLGQVNFFQEFNVCFFNKENYFEVQPNY
jgi:hypothetical protein